MGFRRFDRLVEIRTQVILRRVRPEVLVFPFAERFLPFGNFITFSGGAHLRPACLHEIFLLRDFAYLPGKRGRPHGFLTKQVCDFTKSFVKKTFKKVGIGLKI